jgi:hypothetical protein
MSILLLKILQAGSDISAAPGGVADPQGQVVHGGGQPPRGVGKGRAAGKPGQAPACWPPDMLVVAAEGLVDVEQEGSCRWGSWPAH